MSEPLLARSSADDALLSTHRLLLRLGLALTSAFAWIFVFQYFYVLSGDAGRAFVALLLVYGLAQGITVVLTPIAAAHLRTGTKRALITGTALAALAYTVLGGALMGLFVGDSLVWGVALFAILLGAYRALYFVPYRLSRAATPHRHSRLHALFEILVALMPLFAALTLVSYPSEPIRILFGTSIFLILSIVPALFVKNTREKYSWAYLYTFVQLARERNNTLVLNSLLEGVQGAALFLIWPLAIFFILDSSYAALGIVVSLTLLAILLSRAVLGRWFKRFELHDSPRVHTVLAMSGWIFRLAAGTPVGVILADTYSYATLPSRGTLHDPFVQQQASDHGTFIDEYTTLKEMARASGKIVLCIFVGAAASFVSLPVAFALALGVAAFAAGLTVSLQRFVSSAA
ncbi:MAG: hypothetical protein HYS26_03320 [Candidatus Kaiserbacteria bacterium]|nr:MAG: hypothetical protein HYS26_03320 [Candidatus Kaiserbacteria bacterium]